MLSETIKLIFANEIDLSIKTTIILNLRFELFTELFTGFKPIPSNERWLIDVWWPLPMPVLQT